MQAAEHAPRGPFHLLEHRSALAHIVERGVIATVITLANAPRAQSAAKAPEGLGVETDGHACRCHRVAPRADPGTHALDWATVATRADAGAHALDRATVAGG